MSVLNSILPSTSSIVAQSQAVSRADVGAQSQNATIANNAVMSGQATVVTLSSNGSAKRAASYGESRGVEAGFEGQEVKEKEEKVEEKKEAEKSQAGASVNVSA